jgi:predicted amidohydrolase YtcJ
VLVARAELRSGVLRDLRLARGAIVEIGDRLRPLPDEDVVDVEGCAVLPGLHDHHIHLRAAAAASASLHLSGVTGHDELASALQRASAELAAGAWLRAIGYHESIAGTLDRAALDDLAPPGRPVRVQHRSGALWVLNSAAMAAAELDDSDESGVDRSRGLLWRRDDLVSRVSALDPTHLTDLGRSAAAVGVTGFTDATPNGPPTQARDLAVALRDAGVAQNLHLMAPVGATAPDAERAALGPVKVLLDDDALPPLVELADLIRAAHGGRRPVAVHCVTRVQLVLALTALDDAGAQPGDRIEHGSVIPADLIGVLARLRVTVVTQPHFVTERGDDYRRDVDPHDLGSLYRIRSLLDAGVPVAAGTDAPFGSPDPWPSITAAVERRTGGGHALGVDEAVDPHVALGLYLGRPPAPGDARTVDVGAPADLCVLTVPWRAVSHAPAEVSVRHTFISGALVHPPG